MTTPPTVRPVVGPEDADGAGKRHRILDARGRPADDRDEAHVERFPTLGEPRSPAGFLHHAERLVHDGRAPGAPCEQPGIAAGIHGADEWEGARLRGAAGL